MMETTKFTALYADGITLHLINEDNLEQMHDLFSGFEDSEVMLTEIKENYLPTYENGVRVNYGFYATADGQPAGLSLLGIHSWRERKGYTGADTLLHMRGRGIAPRSKPHLFYLAFEMLGLHRIETGYVVSNTASRRSISKTPGFRFEGVMRESGINDKGEFEDEHLYAILRSDWEKLYDKAVVQVIE
jgi:RimJ/RimL family protein N-acetyltransferase